MVVVLGEIVRAACGQRRSGTDRARVFEAVGKSGWMGQVPAVAVRQEMAGRANRARGLLNWISQGQRWGRCKVRRRAERVSRPAREKKRRRRVLVVTSCSPRPIRVVQRARLWAITPYRVRGRLCTASQAPLAAKRPEGRWLSPDAVLQASDGVLDLGVAAMIGLQFQGCPRLGR